MIEPNRDGPAAAMTASQADDAAIAGAFADYRPDGLEAAYRAYGAALYAVARRILHDPDEAQDCVHDALLRVWQRPNAYRPERGALRPFLMTCVRNEALTRLRRSSRHARNDGVAHNDRHFYEFEIEDPVVRDRLRAALAALPPDQLAAVSLAYFGNCSHTEIASRLALPLGTIKSRLALGLRKLAALVPQCEIS